jgi:sulfoxide reductase heme-binding subunit YedZ
MQPATRSSNQPLGGSSGDWRHRFVRFHVPLALASGMILALFMTLPPFDPQAYPQSDMGSDSAFPARRGEGGSMSQGGNQAGPMGHGEGQAGPTAGPTGHGRNQTGPTGHGEGQAGPTAGSTGHGGNQSGSTGHGADQTGPMDPDGMTESRGRSSFTQRFTVATGYVALGLLALTLLIGPANLLLRKRNPVSSYLRRDVGMWTAIFSVVHVIYGSLLHSGGQLSAFLNYFVAPDGGPLLNSFGLGNWTGLAATVMVVGLLAISSDFALRKLKAGPWKWLQRLNYALFALVILHAFFYGALLRMTSPYTLLLGLNVIAVFIGQAVGVWLWRRRHTRTTANLI